MAKKNKTKKKKKTILVRLVPVLTEAQKAMKGACGFFYTRYKNPRMEGGFEGSGKLKLKKYHPALKTHVWFEEKKIK